MTPESRKKLKDLLISHEQYRQFPYSDLSGHVTIGIGRNLNERGVSQSEALTLLDDDIYYFTSRLSGLLPVFDKLDNNRKIVFLNMCFNLGVRGLLEFRDMLDACEAYDFGKAADEILNSKAAHQDIARYQQLAYIMKTGEL